MVFLVVSYDHEIKMWGYSHPPFCSLDELKLAVVFGKRKSKYKVRNITKISTVIPYTYTSIMTINATQFTSVWFTVRA